MIARRAAPRAHLPAWADFLLVAAFCLPAVLPLAGPPYFFGAHDAEHQVFFFVQFDAALRDGIWYPGWGTDHAFGYGYPTFVYYPPLSFYAAEIFHLLGADMVASVKWTFALATVGAGLAMYSLARRLFGRKGGLLAAALYVYAPYHLTDLYVRAALAEYSAFAWLPLVLLAYHSLVAQPSWRRLGLAGLVTGALFLTHHVTGLMFMPLLAAYVLWRLLARQPGPTTARPALERTGTARGPAGEGAGRRSQPAWRARGLAALAALGGVSLGLVVAAALLLPSFLERGYIQQEQWTRASYNYAQHFVYPFQLLSPFWGYGFAGPGPVDNMPYQLGLVPLLLGIGALALGARRWRAQLWFWAAALGVILLLVMPIAAPLWSLVPLAALVQFPWRLLTFSTLALTLLAAPLGDRARGAADLLVLCLLVVMGSFAYTLPQYTPVAPEDQTARLVIGFELQYPDMVGMVASTQEQPASSPMVEQYLEGKEIITAATLTPGAELEVLSAAGASDRVRVRSQTPATVQFYTYAFPGWRVFLDGERLPESALRAEGPHGLITVDVPPGEHTLLLRWGDTPLRAWSKGLSVAGILLALALAFGKSLSFWYNGPV